MMMMISAAFAVYQCRSTFEIYMLVFFTLLSFNYYR